MKSVLRLGVVTALTCLMLLVAGCPGPTVPGPDLSERPVDDTLPVLTGEALAAADEITDAKIYFEYDKFDIRPESQRVLAHKADLMKRFPMIRVSIQGHCDERGTEEYNLALGERRARAAQEFLIRYGVSPSQIEIISYGKLRPAVMGSNESAWAQNRRDEFTVLNPRGSR